MSMKKMSLIFVFLQGFRELDGIKYMVKNSSIQRVYKPIGEI